MLKILILCSLLPFISCKNEIYEGQSVYEITVNSKDEALLLHDVSDKLLIDTWSHATINRPGVALVPKEAKISFEEELTKAGIKYDIKVENIKEYIDMEERQMNIAQRNGRISVNMTFDKVYTYDEIYEYIDLIEETFPDVVTVVQGGNSFEGRPIKYFKVSSTNFQDLYKPVIIMQSLLHAREWITQSATLMAMHKLVVDGEDSHLLDDYDFIILPIANPDGYAYTHESTRLWRKNRSNAHSDTCLGVDLNRNFDFAWGTGSSNSHCSDTYHGSEPFSEPETRVIRDIMLEHSDRTAMFLDIHSFGSWILYGNGDGTFPRNIMAIHLVGQWMGETIDRIKWEVNPTYVIGNTYELLYAASGSAGDYAMVAGAYVSYTYEMPAYAPWAASTVFGFYVNLEFVEQAGYETWEGIKRGAQELKNIRTNKLHVIRNRSQIREF